MKLKKNSADKNKPLMLDDFDPKLKARWVAAANKQGKSFKKFIVDTVNNKCDEILGKENE